MDAHPIDRDFAFPELATRILEEHEVRSNQLDFMPAGEEPLGIFRGLLAAAMIQVGVVVLVFLGWQFWKSLH